MIYADLELQYTSSENDHETEDADAFTYHEDGSNDDVESEDIVISDNQGIPTVVGCKF